MLNAIIRFSLQQRELVIALAVLLLGYGGWQMLHLPIDVFPDLNRPRVVVMIEAPGMAPEEVEAQITFPLETSLNGATGVQAVRSSSGVGMSVINVEFDWGTDVFKGRQIVNERLALAAEQLPAGIQPQLAPVSSLMGQIMIVGLTHGEQTSALELRTLADWVVRQRLITIPGVSQVFIMGGQRKQFQVLVNPDSLVQYGVTLEEVETALRQSNQNTTGGYLSQQGPNELLVRVLGRINNIEELERVVIKSRQGRSVLLHHVARVVEGPQVARGDSAAFVRDTEGEFSGGPAVVLTISKQPSADTRSVTEQVTAALADLQKTLPADVNVLSALYEQQSFIDLAIKNVLEALRDGSLLVVVVLFVFLLNVRVTLITLTAIPLSIATTAIVFHWFGLSINTMTLGGLAVAMGELVDDAIVDVENIFRRLRENRLRANPLPALYIVYEASREVRNSIVFGTAVVVLVFLPLFALSGIEGRLFAPLGLAYIVSILSSLLVSLTVTPVLSYWLLPSMPMPRDQQDGHLLRLLKGVAQRTMSFSLNRPVPVLAAGAAAVVISGVGLWRLERDFLPPFNEGAVQINVLLPPGTSLSQSTALAHRVDSRLQQIPDLLSFVRKTGRAELDEHAEGVNVSEIIATIDPDTPRSREEVLDELREALDEIPGIVTSVEQPLAHLISHMMSGVMAQIGIKLYGEDLDLLRRTASQMQEAIHDVPGVTDLQLEPQMIIPQLRIEIDDHQLEAYGLHRADINEYIETAMHGRVISQVMQGQRSFDLLLRFEESYREDLDALKRLAIELPGGGTTKLESVAKIYLAGGPNTINREQVQRRIILQCNTAGRGLVDVVEEIKERLAPIESSLPPGYFLEYGGQFESQQSATHTIGILFILSLVGMVAVLYALFRSLNLALQVLVALPAAFLGAVAALYLTGQTLTVAAMVGFISLCGIASRNGILLISHYLHLVEHEGESWTHHCLIRAGQERLAPVLMTALTSGIGLLPLALAAGEPGKEILYPVATVIIGGLGTSTLLEFLIRPALFWKFGIPAAQRAIEKKQLPDQLDAPPQQPEPVTWGAST